MKTKTVKTLPKTASEIQNGGLYVQAVRCGKTTCKCARDEPHSGFYFFTRRNGKLIKTYVRKAEVEGFTRLVVQAKEDRAHSRQTSKQSFGLLKELRQTLHDKQGYINSLKEN